MTTFNTSTQLTKTLKWEEGHLRVENMPFLSGSQDLHHGAQVVEEQIICLKC